MKKTKEIKVRLSEEELHHLNLLVEQSGLSREAYIRSLFRGVIPSNKPSDEFVEVIKQLRAIGNNINQLSMIAHKIGSIDVMKYKHDYERLQEQIQEIFKKINESKQLEVEHGNNVNMGSQR